MLGTSGDRSRNRGATPIVVGHIQGTCYISGRESIFNVAGEGIIHDIDQVVIGSNVNDVA